MSVDQKLRSLVEKHLRAMQMGPAGEDSIVDLFAEDAVYVEPFGAAGGGSRTHTGKEAIRQAFRRGLQWNPPDFRVTLDRLEIEGDELVSHWTYSSAQLRAPVKGRDAYLLEGGRIKRLETRFD